MHNNADLTCFDNFAYIKKFAEQTLQVKTALGGITVIIVQETYCLCCILKYLYVLFILESEERKIFKLEEFKYNVITYVYLCHYLCLRASKIYFQISKQLKTCFPSK